MTKAEQKELNAAVEKYQAHKTSLGHLSELLGSAEKSMWALAKKFAKGRKIKMLNHSTNNTKIVYEEDE